MGWLPEAVSSYGADIDRIFFAILVVTGIVFVGVELALVYFVVKYRGRPGRKAAYIEGSHKAEIIWTAIPAVIIVALAVASQTVWSKVKDPERFPKDALELRVEARQFAWGITYPGADGVLGSGDDFTRYNELRVPVGRPVVIELTSADVIHSFFVPQLRIKQDALPGTTLRAWFEVTQAGEYELGCAELCGVGHYIMKAKVIAQSPDEFEAWQAAQS
jgi:cytochrome c oxidase subunit 2